MTKAIDEPNPRMPLPRVGMGVEPVMSPEEPPIVTEAARAELVASLAQAADDLKAGRVTRMSVAELKADMRADFERITGYKIT